ncbi:MAG: GDYXXLXY domain-containing protein [Verrucomicrobiota bacterium]
MKTLPFVIFLIAAIAQWAAPLSQIWSREQTLSKGTLIQVKCVAPDPYDPLRGRYLAVRPEQDDVTVADGMELVYGQSVYAKLTTDENGLATVSSISATPPASGDFIKVIAAYQSKGKSSFEWPFNRYYINEKLAPEADKWFAENIRNSKGIVAEVRVLDGRAVLEDLSVDGKRLHEILKERVK